jgi:hypothetical protein
MHHRLRLSCAVSLVTSILCLDGASATTVLPADFTTVVTESGVIVHGRVLSVDSRLVGPQRVIESVVTLAVLQSLKGGATGAVSFRVPNGQVGRYRRVLVGAPEFVEGDEVVVFLKGRPPALPSVFGLSQGVYRVTRDAGARVMVMPPRLAAGDGRVVRGDPARVPLPIDAFAREVRAALEGAR